MAETIELNTLGAVIKTAYEGQSNTNAFTDPEKTKLAGINIPLQYEDIEGVPDFITQDRIGVANGIAPLDASGIIPTQYLNVSGLTFQGAWNPNTGLPALVDGSGTVGHFYKAAEAGSYNFGTGNYNFQVGDWVIFAGGTWQRIGVSDAVAMVNGMIGNVVLNWQSVGALPDTYVPDWDSITGKPDFSANEPMPEEIIGRPIYGALLRRTSNLSMPASGTRRTVPMQVATYDIFSGWSGNHEYVIPEGFSFVRVSCSLAASTSSDGSNVSVELRKNETEFAIFVNKSAGSSFGLTYGVSHIEPVVAGDVISFYSSSSTNATILSTQSRTWFQIELFKAVS